MAGPVTYTANNQQYVAVLAGWGGVFPLVSGEVAFKSGRVRNVSRMLAFKLDGKASLPPLPVLEEPVLNRRLRPRARQRFIMERRSTSAFAPDATAMSQ